MTAHTPAPKASGVSALLASLSTEPPPPQPTPKEEFQAMMRHALEAETADEGQPKLAQAAQEKAAPNPVSQAELTASSLILSLLNSPLLSISKEASRKTSDSSEAGRGPSSRPREAASPATPDSMIAGLLLGLQTPSLLVPVKPAVHTAPARSFLVPSSDRPAPSTAAQTTDKPEASKSEPAKEAAPAPPPLPAKAAPSKEAEKTAEPVSGTSAANTGQRMSFRPESNEIAGRMEQKLPLAPVAEAGNADTGGRSHDGGAKSSLSFSWHDTPSESMAIMELSAKATATTTPVVEATTASASRVSGGAPLERLEQTITREAVNVRRAGAQTLGVTLKLDPHTQLYLQLTTNNGMVQASVRCERGQFAPEEAQWAQLQQSLARQNVELLPMSGGSSPSFQNPSEERSRQPASRENWPGAGPATPPVQARQKQKEQKSPRNSWETWA